MKNLYDITKKITKNTSKIIMPLALAYTLTGCNRTTVESDKIIYTTQEGNRINLFKNSENEGPRQRLYVVEKNGGTYQFEDYDGDGTLTSNDNDAIITNQIIFSHDSYRPNSVTIEGTTYRKEGSELEQKVFEGSRKKFAQGAEKYKQYLHEAKEFAKQYGGK